MATSLLDPVAQHAADIVQQRGLGKPDRNALFAGVLAQRTARSGLFSKDSKVKERDLRVFLFDCAIVLLAPKDKDKDGETGWVPFCDPIPIELLTLRAPRPTPPPSVTPAPPSHRRSWFLDRLPASPISPPARAKTPPPFGSPARPGSVPSSPRRPPASSSSLPLVAPAAAQDEFQLVLSTLGKKDAAAARIWPLTLQAADAGEQRSWVQCVSTRQEEVRMRGRDGAGRGWRLVPIHLGPVSTEMGKITCYVDYDVGFHKARLWGTPMGLYEHILTAPNQETAVRKILALPGITHVLVMDFDERLMIVLVAEQTAYLAPFPSPGSMLEVSRLKRIGTNITHIAAGVLVLQPPPLPSTPPSAFVDPTPERRERRKSATLTKPPPRVAVISGASSSKSDVTSALRVAKEREKDKESVRTASGAAPVPAPSADAPTAPATATNTTASSPSRAAVPVPAPAPAPTPRQTLSPGKSKDKKVRRLSDIGIFAIWRRKPEKNKDKKEKEKEKSSTSPVPASTRFSTATTESKPKTSVGSLKPGHGYDGPPLSKAKSATLPSSLMRLPSLEFDQEESLTANKNDKAAEGTNGKTETTTNDTEPRQSTTNTLNEVGVLVDSPKPGAFTQTLPSRPSVPSAFARGLTISRKRTTDSSGSKSIAASPPPKIQLALDFPSIAWPSVLDANGKAGSEQDGDRFAGSDFLADVERDLGDLVAGGLGMSLSEEKAGMSVGEDADGVGRSKSPVPEAVTEEPGKMKELEQPAQENGNGNGNGAVSHGLGGVNSTTVEQPASSQVAPQPQIPMAQPQNASRSQQPQHTRFLVLSKSTTLSTTVKLYTVGGLKVEDEGDIGGGRLSFYKEIYVPSQTYSIDFLRSRICFSGTDGFEIMDPTTGKLDPFLDPVEMTEPEGPLGFLITHPRRPKPSAVFRVDQKFLCCYDEFAFFLDKFGKRAREDWLVRWHGTPTSFAVQYPYLFAFEPEFTEIRHCTTGELVQLIPQPSLTRLQAGEFIAPAQKQDGVPLRRVNGEVLLESEGSLYALRPMQP
ncbi:RHO1 GDP-GTP exchange protein 2 [Ceratobasidium sp. 428]|nr:RHO1 GDP-GTP exchange protein 2 [Ceratobasidium sp. 428]